VNRLDSIGGGELTKMPTVYKDTVKSHISNCETCRIAGRPTAMCNAGWGLFLYWYQNNHTHFRDAGSQEAFENLKKDIV